MDEIDIKNDFNFLGNSTIAHFLKNRNEIYFRVRNELKYLENIGVKAILKGNKDYPSKLNSLIDSSPPVIYAYGNLNLLDNKTVGIVGSRQSSDIGLKFAKIITREYLFENYTIVSGYAMGIDYIAHKTALKNNGKTIFVLPKPITNFDNKIFSDDEINDTFISEDNILFISEFLKCSPISIKVMPIIRNMLIVGLSDEICIVEAGLNSGTMDTAKKSIEFNIPLKVVDYSSITKNPDGNQFLLDNNICKIDFLDYRKKQCIGWSIFLRRIS